MFKEKTIIQLTRINHINNKVEMPSKINKKIFYSLILFIFLMSLLFIFFSFNKSNIIFLKFSKAYKNQRLLDHSNIYDSFSNKKKNNICKYFMMVKIIFKIYIMNY